MQLSLPQKERRAGPGSRQPLGERVVQGHAASTGGQGPAATHTGALNDCAILTMMCTAGASGQSSPASAYSRYYLLHWRGANPTVGILAAALLMCKVVRHSLSDMLA